MQVASQSVARAATVDLEQEANSENMLGVYTSSVCMPVYGDPSFSAVNDAERELRHTHTSTRSDVLGSSVVAIFVRHLCDLWLCIVNSWHNIRSFSVSDIKVIRRRCTATATCIYFCHITSCSAQNGKLLSSKRSLPSAVFLVMSWLNHCLTGTVKQEEMQLHSDTVPESEEG